MAPPIKKRILFSPPLEPRLTLCLALTYGMQWEWHHVISEPWPLETLHASAFSLGARLPWKEAQWSLLENVEESWGDLADGSTVLIMFFVFCILYILTSWEALRPEEWPPLPRLANSWMWWSACLEPADCSIQCPGPTHLLIYLIPLP